VNIRRLRKEIENLEAGRRWAGNKPDEEAGPGFVDFWEMEMEWEALHLIRGLEPTFTLDEGGAFWTLDGRFALSRYRMDLRGLHGPRTQEIQETMPRERWGRFLEADEEAAELLEALLELAESTAVPDAYREPAHEWHDLGEINDRASGEAGQHELGSIFEDAEEREATRRMTWSLIHNPDARAMLSQLTRRRDAFVAAEGSMPPFLPPAG
jgi:hypothetical protein